MKKLFILSAIAMSGLIANKANAQLSIHLGFHIPVRQVYVPAPPPVEVYDQPVYDDDNTQVNYNYNGDDYYYLPEVEAYYSPAAHCYYYNNGSNWITCAYLPGAYRNYNWRTAVRYEVRGQRPYLRHDFYRQRWGGWNGDRGNWGHRFDRRYDGGYAYQNHDNRGWDRGRNNDRGNWGGRPSVGGDRGNWGGRPNQGNGNDRGNWGGQNRGGGNWGSQDHNNQNNDGGQGRGNWGGRSSNQNDGGSRDHGNRGGDGGGQHFADNRGGGISRRQ